MINRSKRQPNVSKPNTRKQDLRNKGKDRFTPTGNGRIVHQNRKLLGKHYANKYLIAQSVAEAESTEGNSREHHLATLLH